MPHRRTPPAGTDGAPRTQPTLHLAEPAGVHHGPRLVGSSAVARLIVRTLNSMSARIRALPGLPPQEQQSSATLLASVCDVLADMHLRAQ